MTAGRNMANVVGGKTARACDNCIRKRARWFCAADDAFLCQACDASVHSANPLARRHERVRLKNASSKPSVVDSPPAWHQGITRKARTPRHGKHCVFRALKSKEQAQSRSPIVPDLGADDMSHEETEEQLLYRVPVFDPFVAELGTSAASDAAAPMATKDADSVGSKSKTGPVRDCYGHDDLVEDLNGFLPSEMDLAEFAADVESLLGRGLEHESFGMEDLGLLDCAEKRSMEGSLGGGKVQVKDEEEGEAMAGSRIYSEVDMTREPRFELGFDYDSVAAIDGEEEKKAITGGEAGDVKRNKKILLRLDYDAVMAAWAGQGSPWTGGDRPELDPNDDCWPDCMVATFRVGVESRFIITVRWEEWVCMEPWGTEGEKRECRGIERSGERGCSQRK
ncbi:zinc finger protein CONSTANS-LIKE 16-like isoform X2 [Malania oleifera]|uniref:zinc finger protein CONSTANS-LIKE 16-like isoform X2 n=1 Tax=Malania oleifera TaxID=397392 RepID=UPI0025AE785A|nr:zinc finger protein CONSTANS-LIKE 16-like isoform X2 [Malania oleifera]